MTTATKTHWTELQSLLRDSDNCPIPDELFRSAMMEFRDDHGISDYYFCDFEREGTPDPYELGVSWDTYNECWEEACECGPRLNEIDFSDLDAERIGHVVIRWNINSAIDGIDVDDGWAIADQYYHTYGNECWTHTGWVHDAEECAEVIRAAGIECQAVVLPFGTGDAVLVVPEADVKRAQAALEDDWETPPAESKRFDGPGTRPTNDYCEVCGYIPKAETREPNRVPHRWWNPDDGWHIGTLCRLCDDEVLHVRPIVVTDKREKTDAKT